MKFIRFPDGVRWNYRKSNGVSQMLKYPNFIDVYLKSDEIKASSTEFAEIRRASGELQ